MKWKHKRDPLERLMDKRCIDPETGCWNFTGSLQRSGYGALGVDLKTVYAHRYAYERLVGEIPSGLVVDHLCRNRACFNPEHLEVVTQRENVLRGERAGQRVTTYTNPQGYRACRACIRSRRTA